MVSMPSPAAITSPAGPKRTACPRRWPIARREVSTGAETGCIWRGVHRWVHGLVRGAFWAGYHRSSSARREPRPPLHQGRRLQHISGFVPAWSSATDPQGAPCSPARSQLRWPARSLGSTQRRLYDQAMERRNSRDIGPPSQMIEGHDRCGDKSAAQSGLFNQNGQTEVEMAIVLAKNNLMTTPIVDPKEIDPVGRNVIAQLRRCLKTKPRNQSVP